MFFLLFLVLITIKFASSAKLEIFETTSNSNSNATNLIANIYEIPAPHFSLGNSDFPVSGLAIFGKGCDAFSEISTEEIEKLLNSSSSSSSSSSSNKLIAFVEYESTDCFSIEYILQCQSTSWCGGVFTLEPFFKPAGIEMWIGFDVYRDRNEYKVPLVQSTLEDFNMLKNLIYESNKQNRTYRLTLTKDPNVWAEMYQSITVIILFQIFCPLWSLICLIFTAKILFHKSSLEPTKDNNSSHPVQNVKHKFRPKLSPKTICLSLNSLGNISRLIFYISPLNCHQLYVYPAYVIILAASYIFELSTSILLSLTIRELTNAKQHVNWRTKIRILYLVIIIILSFSFTIFSFEGFRIKPIPRSEIPTFVVLAIFLVIINIGLGSWYFWQAYQFLKKCNKSMKSTNPQRIALTQLSLVNSAALVLFGVISIFISIKETNGSPWEYFSNFFFYLLQYKPQILLKYFYLVVLLLVVKVLKKKFKVSKKN